MRPSTPRGFRDVLVQETAERSAIERALESVFAAWGYGLVRTPALETWATLEAGAGPQVDGSVFVVSDKDGTLLGLRPEMTVPISRMAATRLAQADGPHRLAYVADVFREHASLRGQPRQFTQAGVEFIGASGPDADAEVVALLADALAGAGVRETTIAVGTVAVLGAVLETCDAPGEWRGRVIEAARRRDLVAIDGLADDSDVSPMLANAVRGIPRLRGGAEAVDACRRLADPCGCADALEPFADMLDLLRSAGVDGSVLVDFGIVRDFGYYSGLVVEAYCPQLGVPLGGGGRYDGLAGAFDAPAPAAGFALGIERLHIALEAQGALRQVRGLDAVCGGVLAADVMSQCSRLRAARWRVAAAAGKAPAEVTAAAASAGADLALWADETGVRVVDAQGSIGRELDASEPKPSEAR